MVIRQEEDQELRAYGDAWVIHVKVEGAGRMRGVGCRASREPGQELSPQGRRGSGQEATSGSSHQELGGCQPHFLPRKYAKNVKTRARRDLGKPFLTQHRSEV